MALIQLAFVLSTRDSKGFTHRYKYWLTGDNADGGFNADIATKAQALEAAILGLTNAVGTARASLTGGDMTAALAYGGTGVFQQNWIAARMMFTDANGVAHVFSVGAPKSAIFDTDGTTVLNDGTQALVVAYVNAVKNAVGTVFVSTPDGAAYTSFVGGKLKLGKQPRRFNEKIKSSHLIQGEGE